jgi:hypothetical protein
MLPEHYVLIKFSPPSPDGGIDAEVTNSEGWDYITVADLLETVAGILRTGLRRVK